MTNRTLYAATLTAALLAVGVTQPVLAANTAFDTQIIETVQDQELDNFKKFKFKKFGGKKFGGKKFGKKKFVFGF